MSLQRIAYILKTFPKLSETFITEELAEVRRRGIDVSIYALKRPAENLQHELVNRAGLLDLVTYDLDEFRDRLDAFQPQLIHAHFATEPTRIARKLAADLGVPFTFTAHGHDVYRKPPADFADRAAAASAVVTVSHANVQYICSRFGILAAKIHRVPCGIDVRRFQPNLSERQRGLIVCVARFSPVKNHELLLRACRLLKDRHVDFHCVLIGEGRRREPIERQRTELGLNDVVELVGALTQHDVMRWWQRAGVAVLTSHSEGMPISLMEASACGVPIVATAVGGIPELVLDGRTGLVVEPDNERQLAAALESMLIDPEKATRMGASARALAVREFTVGKQVDDLLRIWRSACSSWEESPCPLP